MGFNVSGIAINGNFQGREEQLWEALGFNVVFEKEIYFEEASSNWKDDVLCDVYFTERGTLIFLSMDRCIEGYSIPDQQCFTFALSETSMAFNFEYAEGSKVLRRFMEVNGEELSAEGTPLEVELNTSDSADKIWKQIEVVLGASFWSIDPAAKAYCYQFKAKEAAPVPAPVVSVVSQTSKSEDFEMLSSEENLAMLLKTMDEKKDQKFRFGKFSLMFFQQEDFNEIELNKLKAHPSFFRIERFKNFSKGPVYIVTMKTKNMGFLKSIIDLLRSKNNR
ncbi:MAG: hypothetical protein K2P88_15410 [Chitinophagaceae bacterium]|uniref:hypothetical protein n=1 Tax=unclassified Paraflavitalea TaxID=2798305 RepID=UPI003D342616|nr:hypothetical protein [Chitinophagaceae bacterium]